MTLTFQGILISFFFSFIGILFPSLVCNRMRKSKHACGSLFLDIDRWGHRDPYKYRADLFSTAPTTSVATFNLCFSSFCQYLCQLIHLPHEWTFSHVFILIIWFFFFIVIPIIIEYSHESWMDVFSCFVIIILTIFLYCDKLTYIVYLSFLLLPVVIF